MRNAVPLAIVLLACSVVAGERPAPSLTGQPAYTYPLIKGHGKIVTSNAAAHQPKAGSKVLYDITGAGEPGEVVKGMDRAATFLNLCAANDISPDDVAVTLVFHGDATRAVLTDAAYVDLVGTQGVSHNPNLPLLRELKKHGVAVYVCLQALAHREIPLDSVDPVAEPAASALTVIVNEQSAGYAYIPFG